MGKAGSTCDKCLQNSGPKMLREKKHLEKCGRVKDNIRICFKEIDYENAN